MDVAKKWCFLFVADDNSRGVHFQDFKVSAGVMQSNPWHNTVSTKRCQLNLL